MKSILLSFFIVCFSVVMGQEYRPMLEANNQWIVTQYQYDFDGGGFHQFDSHFRLTSQTHQINGKNFIELQERKRERYDNVVITDWSDWGPTFFHLAEVIDDKKVYVYYLESPNHAEGEFLLYDFNLEIGDILEFNGFVHWDSAEPQVITNITYENAFGVDNVKTYHFDNEVSFPFKIHEGIGSTFGLVYAPFYQDLGYELSSFGTNLSIHEVELSKTTVYPNPFKNQLQIDSKKTIKQLEIFDLQGKLILSKSNLVELNSNLSQFKSGVYAMRLTFDDNQKEVVKIIKK